MRDRFKRVGQVQPRDDCLALSSLGVRQDEVVFVAPLVPQEALLREAELFVSDRLVGQSVGQKRGEEFGDGVPQSERAPVLQHASVSFFVYQHCVGGLPGHEDCLEPQTNVVERCEERSPVRLTEITVGHIVGPGAELFIRRNRRSISRSASGPRTADTFCELEGSGRSVFTFIRRCRPGPPRRCYAATVTRSTPGFDTWH